MAYNYSEQRAFVFTEEGQVVFLKVRDRAKYLLKLAGAFNYTAVTKDCTGNSWDITACVDRLVELGEIVPLNEEKCWRQFTVYYDGKRHNR